MALIQEWVDDVNVEVPACLENTVTRAVKQSMQEFFTDSESWRHTERLTLSFDRTEYILILPENTYTLATDFAKVFDDGGLSDDLIAVKRTDLFGYGGNNLMSYAVEGSTLYINAPVDEAGAELSLGLILRPTRHIEEIPDELADKYFEAIRSGTLMRLKSMMDKDWTDINGAQKHGAMFRDGIARAKREAKQTRSRLRRPAKFNRGFSW